MENGNQYTVSVESKNKCVSCSAPIESTEKWFNSHGNFCAECDTLAGKVASGLLKRKEANQQIEERRKEYVSK